MSRARILRARRGIVALVAGLLAWVVVGAADARANSKKKGGTQSGYVER